MRIHTTILDTVGIWRAATTSPDVTVYVTRHGSRSRDHAFEVSLTGHGARHTRVKNTGTSGAAPGEHAATWSDWGRFFAALFAVDPRAKCCNYNGAADFHKQTHGLFRADAAVTPATLAAAVDAGQRRAPNCSRSHPIAATADRTGLPVHIVKSAIFGE